MAAPSSPRQEFTGAIKADCHKRAAVSPCLSVMPWAAVGCPQHFFAPSCPLLFPSSVFHERAWTIRELACISHRVTADVRNRPATLLRCACSERLGVAALRRWTGKDMREGHKHLIEKGLNDSHVDIVIEHLGATLKELGVGDAEIGQVAALANSVRNDVLNR